VTALIAGLLAASATMTAMAFDLWNQVFPVQIVATLVAIVAAISGWRGGIRAIIIAGVAAAALSWVPLGAVFYFCAVLDACP
jgi:hypothetical protein